MWWCRMDLFWERTWWEEMRSIMMSRCSPPLPPKICGFVIVYLFSLQTTLAKWDDELCWVDNLFLLFTQFILYLMSIAYNGNILHISKLDTKILLIWLKEYWNWYDKNGVMDIWTMQNIHQTSHWQLFFNFIFNLKQATEIIETPILAISISNHSATMLVLVAEVSLDFSFPAKNLWDLSLQREEQAANLLTISNSQHSSWPVLNSESPQSSSI
jgi:hypothetical protein